MISARLKVFSSAFLCSFFKKVSLVCFCFFTSYHISYAQTTFSFHAQSLSANQVLEKLEKELDLQFNYNHDLLPEGTFSFSCSGDVEHVLKISCSVLNRNFASLDKGVYVIQAKVIEEENKISPFQIRGSIKDEYEQAIIGATIWIPQLQKATLSDAEGSFLLEGYFDQKEKLEIRYLGYESVCIRIGNLLTKPGAIIFLKTKSHILSDIEVTEFISWRDQESTNIDILQLDKMLPVSGRTDNDALSAVQLLPGISTASENISELQIRGGLPDQTQYEWNNIKIFQPSHFFGKLSAVNPFMVDQIQVNRNGGSANDSGQASGQISLSNQPSDSLSVKTYLDLLYTNVGVSVPLFKNKINLDAAWRKSFFNVYKSVVYDNFFDQSFQFGRIPNEQYYLDFFGVQEYIALVPNMEFQDLSLSLNIKPSPKDEIQFSTLYLKNDLIYIKDNLGDFITVDSLLLSSQGFNFSYNHQWSDQFNTEISWSKSGFENRYRYVDLIDTINGEEDTQYNLVNEKILGFHQYFEHQKIDVKIGYEFQRWDFNSFNSNTNPTGTYVFYDDQAKAQEHGVYAQSLLKFSPRWQLETGIRWSKYNRTDRQFLEPRIHFSFIPAEHWILHAHFGKYHQVLNHVNVFTSIGIEGSYWYLADEENEWYNETPVAQNQQWSVGSRFRKNKWSASLDFYKKKITNINTLAFDFTFEENPYRLAEMDIRGLETSIQYDHKWLSFLWTYEYTKDEYYLLDEQEKYPSPYTQPHKISLFQGFKWKQFEASILWRFASGRPFSKPSELETYIDGGGETRYQLLFENLLTEREENYHTMDFSLEYKWGNPKKSKIYGKFALSLINLYNRRNIVKNYFYIDYKVEPFEGVRLERRGLPISPNFSITLGF